MSEEEKEAKREYGQNRCRDMKESKQTKKQKKKPLQTRREFKTFFLYDIKISEKTLKFEFKKKKFHVSNQTNALNLVNVNQILISNKFKHSETGFKYFIGYKNDNIFRPLCIILPQMSGYIKYFDNGEKNMSLMIEDESILIKYNCIWNKILKIKQKVL